MLLQINNLEKTIGPKVLLKDVSLRVEEGEKLAMIGRNGVGKTTLFNILSGEDTDYYGEISLKKGVRMVVTKQEHFFDNLLTPLSYILDYAPRYRELKHIIDTYPDKMGNDMKMIEEYTDAIHHFSDNDYYTIEDRVIETLNSFRIDFNKALSSLQSLSGGEKRFVELAKVMYSEADLALIDEPTNHMDYVGKKIFIEWMQKFQKAVVVISHDRDVLEEVDRIIEMKDKHTISFKGNYNSYLDQNSLNTLTQVKAYEDSIKELEKLHEQMIAARVRKLSAKSDSGRKNAKVMEERFAKEYAALKEKLDKPSFWIDEGSIENINETVTKKYEKYKDKNIRMHIHENNEITHELLRIEDLSLGYTEPLFFNVNILVSLGDRVMIRGRNGVGKTTLVKAIIASAKESKIEGNIFSGNIKVGSKVRLGIYQQEVDPGYLDYTLYSALEKLYRNMNIEINQQGIFKVMSDYLFHPQQDRDIRIKDLSGGQKARFQLIKLLANKPNMLILDEPTNHLDLPSIEEMERALSLYSGAIIYITHDSYFVKKIGGKIIPIGLQ